MKNEFVLPVLNLVGIAFVIAGLVIPRIIRKKNELSAISTGLILSSMSIGIWWTGYLFPRRSDRFGAQCG